MPWEVTQETLSSVSFSVRDSGRTVCRPGSTRAPLPVTILKSIPSRVSSVPRVSPEMMRASLGSATFHISFVATQMTPITTAAPTMIEMSG